MASGLDMALDDIIKSSKKRPISNNNNNRDRGGRRDGGFGTAGPVRRFPNRTENRWAPYASGKAPDSMFRRDAYVGPVAGFGSVVSSVDSGTKLYISNLDYGVSNEDIKELFLEVGELKRASINYDRSGRSKGTAEVVYLRKQDALAAIKRYNNVQLDGKPMKIEMVGASIVTPTIVPRVSNGGFRNPNSGRGGGFKGRSQLRGRGRGRSRGQRTGRAEPVSAAALDADLDNFLAKAMQAN